MQLQRFLILKPYAVIRELLQGFIHLFYPHVCLHCASEQLHQVQIICSSCESQLPFTNFAQIKNNPVEKIFWGRTNIYQANSILFFTKDSIVQSIIFELKYKQNKKAGYLLGRLIAIDLCNNPKYSEIDYLVPIPISIRKQRTRGFNQSQIICEAIVAGGFQKTIVQALKKTKSVFTQTHKNRTQRGELRSKMFAVNDNYILKNKHLLIIDDVLTTGATLEAASICLWDVAPASISILTAAYTYH